MSIYSHELIEEYVIEIISRCQTIRGRCESLLSKDFASEAPKNLASTLIKICIYLEGAINIIFKSIEWKDDVKIDQWLKLLQTTDAVVKDLGSHLRYIDGAQTQKLPWSFIKPIEKLVKLFLSDLDIVIMLRPQWKYNYSLLTTNLYEYYSTILSAYENFVPEKKLTDVLSQLNKFFYIISFPSIERKNIHLHCLIGHEIGHLLIKDYFIEKRKQEVLIIFSDKIKPHIEKTKEDLLKDVPPLFVEGMKQQLMQNAIKGATDAWKRGLEELLSDIVGSFLFGPAVLFSTLEIALQDLNGLDNSPNAENNYYPPWRMRLRNILNVIKETNLFPLPTDYFISKNVIDCVNKRFNLIEDIVNDMSDEQEIKQNFVLSIAYDEIKADLVKAKGMYSSSLKKLEPVELYKNLSHLIERLDYGIPPNAYEKTINNREPATVAEIINSVWFHKLSWEDQLLNGEGNFNENIYPKRNRLNQLALKALEYSDIEKEYIEWYFKEHGHFPKYEDEQ